jgi:signal transduction histidine kinase
MVIVSRRSAKQSALIALVVGVCCTVDSAWAQPQKEVLVLYATRRDAQIATVGDRELPRILERGLPEGLDYYSEFLEQSRFDNIDYQQAFRDFLALKYRGHQFDLVIAMGDRPTAFVTDYRHTLFQDTPLVFFADRAVARPPNATGLIAELNLSGTLDFATELQPDTQNVFVVSGASEADREYRDVAQRQFRAFDSKLAITHLSGLPTGELEARLSSLPAHSIVYYLIVERDGAGQNVNPLQYLSRVSAVANAPVYSWVNSTMDYGIVGGSLKDQTAQTRAVGELALRVLRGEAAHSIPVSSADLNVKQVDWRQLRRWGINETRAPAGTLVRFREPSVWDRYSGYILAAVVLLLAQSGLIAGLLVHRSRRRRAEDLVLENQAELRRSYDRIRDLAARLLTAQETERARIARDLHDDISQQMALLEIDLEQLSGIVQGQAAGLSHDALQRTQGLAKSVHDLSHRLHPAKLRLIGLVAALQGLRRELSQSDIAITFTHRNVPPALPEELTLCLFRIVQEALRNALKYSHGHHVSVELVGVPDGLTLTVADDGIGFEVDATWHKGLGLISMRERLEAVGGSLEIRSTPGAGTRLHVAVPLRHEPNAAEVGKTPVNVPILNSASNQSLVPSTFRST